MDESRPLPMFRCEQIESGKLAKEWLEWKGSLECYFESYQITDQKLKRSKMLHLGGPQLQRVFRSLEGTEHFSMVLLEKPWYDVAVERLEAYFKPRKQDVLERYKLRNMKQGANERFAHFVLRLRQQLQDCGLEKYGDVRRSVEEMMLIDVIVEGCTSQELRRKILEKDQSLSDIEALGESLESVRAQELEMNNKHPRDDTGPFEVRKVDKFFANRDERKQERIVKRFIGKPVLDRANRDQKVVCYSCGENGHISRDAACPAKGQRCRRCRSIGHLEKACRKRPSKFPEYATKKVRAVNDESSSATTEKEPFVDGVDQKVYYTFHTGNLTNLIECEVGGILIEMIVDSGSDANLLTVETWEMMKAKCIIVQKCIKGSDKILKAYGSDLPLVILGSFVAVVKLAKRSVSAEFFVVEKGQRNILGDATSKQLGVLKIGVDINQVQDGQLTPEFPRIKGVQVHIQMDPSIVPVFQPLRRIPIPLEHAVNQKLDELLSKDIIESKKGPATWVSPLVVAKKSNGEIRLCVDLRRVNQAVIRERHPMPIIEDVLAKIGRGNIWSSLDIKDAFFLLELDEESRSVTTFISHRGLYQFKRLPFGLVSAPEIFQRTMDGILADCEGTYWYLDDVGVEGSTLEEHDERLMKV